MNEKRKIPFGGAALAVACGKGHPSPDWGGGGGDTYTGAGGAEDPGLKLGMADPAHLWRVSG